MPAAIGIGFGPVDGLLIVYLAGVAAALIFTDGHPVMRVVLAVLWPLGPAAFVVTVAVLLAASLVAFPFVGLLAAGAGASALWWLLA